MSHTTLGLDRFEEAGDSIIGFGLWRAVFETAMRDGVLLESDIYTDSRDLPARPVILERTPYGRRRTRKSDGSLHGVTPAPPEWVSQHFVSKGYHIVRQDCRGRGNSGGQFIKYLNEAQDGFDTVEWIAQQPWCDGRVFTMGVSYAAHAQSALATQSPPHLAGMFLDSGGFFSAYANGVRMGGAFELKQATWALSRVGVANSSVDANALKAVANEPIHDWFARMPWRRGASPLSHVPEYEDFLFDQWEHEEFSSFWKQPGIYARDSYADFPDVPTLHMSSWFDPYTSTAIENFRRLSEVKDSRTELVLGPWTHGRRSVSYAGDADFGPQARLEGNLAADYAAMRSDWFDASTVNDFPDSRPAVRYFLMGGGDGTKTTDGRILHGGEWRHASTWPPQEAEPLQLHLDAGGALSWEPTGRIGKLTYRHDPFDPVPTIGGQVTSGEPLMEGGAFDQRPNGSTFQVRASPLPLAARDDVLVFQTPPLTEPLLIAGPVSVRLTVSSTAADTDIAIKLLDVYPPSPEYPAGYAMNLTEGILRCRYRNSFEKPEAMEKDQPYEISVAAPDTANIFAVGHRLRLDIASSNFPRFDINYGTANLPTEERVPVVAVNTIHFPGAVLQVHYIRTSGR